MNKPKANEHVVSISVFFEMEVGKAGGKLARVAFGCRLEDAL